MGRALFGLFGAALVLFPGRIRTVYERIAFENPEECTPKASSERATRIEGLVLVAASAAGGRAYARMANLVGAVGVFALLFPRRAIDISTALVYRRPETVASKDGFVTVVRGFGLLYLALAVGAFVRRRDDD